MKRRKKKQQKIGGGRIQMRNRLILLIILFALVSLALILRLAYIQFFWAPELQRMAFAQQNRDRILSPVRGLILDRNGRILSTNLGVDTITISPNNVRNSNRPPEEVARKLSVLLEMDYAEILEKISRKSEFAIIARKVDKQVGNAVREWIAAERIFGVYVDEDTRRHYPFNRLASHVIGMTGIDNQGISGIEFFMEEHLKGVPGRIIVEVDVHGTQLPFAVNPRIEAQPGHNVVLTIDETIQSIAEKALDKAILENNVAQGGTAIVMDPRTGEILAMVSRPDFNLNDPRAVPPGQDLSSWSGYTDQEVDLLNKTIWRNKVLNDLYEPGSTFKVFVAAMALEENRIQLETMVECLPIIVQGRKISCWSDIPHGSLTFLQAMYYSCNPVFVKVAQEIGIADFYRYVRMFGFMDRTGITLLGEQNSLFHPNPSEVDMAVAAFGQRFEITPLQLIVAYNAIANGGYLIEPTLVREILDHQGNEVKKMENTVIRQVISHQTSEILRSMLEGVVSQGTGRNAMVPGFTVAGKTGTSETKDEGVYIASFGGFAPADNPLISVLVTLNDPRGESRFGGVIAAPVVAQIIEETLQYLQVPRREHEVLVRREVMVPEMQGRSLDLALATLEDKGLKFRIMGQAMGEDIHIIYQYPQGGRVIAANSVVVLYTYQPNPEDVLVQVPNLRNRTVADATRLLNNLGLNIQVEGNGVGISQEVRPGTKVEPGSVIRVTFRHLDNVE